jgi:hypothetical protein
MSLNLELLRKVRDAIADEDNPVGFDMAAWEPGLSDCGTACCIAGHVVLQGGKPTTPTGPATASWLLDIGVGDGHHLFYGFWHSSYRDDWDGADLDSITRAEAVAYLDRCLEAGEIVR